MKFVATPHSPASLVNSLAGAPLPRTLAYDWFSNAITITWVHFGVTVVRPHGEAAAPAVAPPRELGDEHRERGCGRDQEASAGHGHDHQYAGVWRLWRELPRGH